MKRAIELFDDEGGSETVVLPFGYAVCPRCDGHGTHDCWEGGMTGDEMAQQGPEFFDDYMSGMYDRICTECRGNRVVEALDRDLVSPELQERYDAHVGREEAYEAEARAEREYFQRAAEAMARW